MVRIEKKLFGTSLKNNKIDQKVAEKNNFNQRGPEKKVKKFKPRENWKKK